MSSHGGVLEGPLRPNELIHHQLVVYVLHANGTRIVLLKDLIEKSHLLHIVWFGHLLGDWLLE